jgi:hypothetical protein
LNDARAELFIFSGAALPKDFTDKVVFLSKRVFYVFGLHDFHGNVRFGIGYQVNIVHWTICTYD